MSRLRALIIEDEPLVAEDIAGCVEALGYEVVFISYSAEECIQKLPELKFDFALLDITLAGEKDGIELAEHINSLMQVPLIFLTSHSDRATLERAKKVRPAAYLLKPFDENDLRTSLEIAIFNHLNPENDSKELSMSQINQVLPNELSEKEFSVLQLLRKGMTNQEIADQLFVSVNTVKTHLNRLYSKLNAGNRTEALFRVDSLLKQ